MALSPSVFLGSFLATVGMLLAAIRWVGPRGWMDHPDARKQHGRPVPRVGGIVLLGMVALGHLLGQSVLPLSPLEWTTVYGMGLLGLLDDRLDLRPRWKAGIGLFWAIPLAGVATWQLLHDGASIQVFGRVFPEQVELVFPLLMLWFWALPQSFNLIDGLNGLSIGMAALLCQFTGYGLAQAPFLWGVLGALFLFNYPRARHFLGDAGSLFLGTLFAILAMKAFMPHRGGQPLWLLAYPIVDVTMVVVIRTATHQPLGSADRNHLHHWMVERLHGRDWLATPLLLGLAALPMLRGTSVPAAWALSRIGYLALIGLAALNVRQRLGAFRAAKASVVSVRRKIPGMAPVPAGESSGAHNLP